MTSDPAWYSALAVGFDEVLEFEESRASSTVISARILSISVTCSAIRFACSSISVRKVTNSRSSASGEGWLVLFGA